MYIALCASGRDNRPSLSNNCSVHNTLIAARRKWARFDKCQMNKRFRHKIFIKTAGSKFIRA